MSAPALQLVFFDGEEAFKDWTDTDSLYGSRHLAAAWKNSDSLRQIRFLCLLDLVGASTMRFYNWFPSTRERYGDQELWALLMQLEQSHRPGVSQERRFFPSAVNPPASMRIQDDHLPFWRENVPILHLISFPFPKVWHTPQDDVAHLDWDAILHFHKIIRQFAYVQSFINVLSPNIDLLNQDEIV
ncbi:MAG: M28 family peptidase [archaeon]|nr:M28 family peptidase [archaeon]